MLVLLVVMVPLRWYPCHFSKIYLVHTVSPLKIYRLCSVCSSLHCVLKWSAVQTKNAEKAGTRGPWSDSRIGRCCAW